MFLHGLGTTAGMWAGHVLALPELRCVCPDLPGHGSAQGRPWVSTAETAREIAALIERTPEARAHVVGLSLGGAVAVELMNTRPELLDRVVVDGASAVPWRFAPLLTAGAAAVSPFLHTTLFLRVVAQLLSIGPERREGFYREFRLVDPGSFRRSIRDALRIRLRDASFARPVLLLSGGHDVAATRVSNATLAAALPHATAWFVPGGWHAWVATRPETHKAAIRAFLLDEPLPASLVRETSRPRQDAFLAGNAGATSAASTVPGDTLLHPVALAALALLLLNDHVLKQAWPGVVTGKLSDVAGLAFFPLLLVGLWEVLLLVARRWRGPTRRAALVATIATGVTFVAVKTTTAGAWLFGTAIGIGQWLPSALASLVTGSAAGSPAPAQVTADPTDLVALPALLVALAIGLARSRRRPAG